MCSQRVRPSVSSVLESQTGDGIQTDDPECVNNTHSSMNPDDHTSQARRGEEGRWVGMQREGKGRVGGRGCECDPEGILLATEVPN